MIAFFYATNYQCFVISWTKYLKQVHSVLSLSFSDTHTSINSRRLIMSWMSDFIISFSMSFDFYTYCMEKWHTLCWFFQKCVGVGCFGKWKNQWRINPSHWIIKTIPWQQETTDYSRSCFYHFLNFCLTAIFCDS